MLQSVVIPKERLVTQLLSPLASLFLLIGVGLFVRWRNILPRDATVAVFNAAVINLALPASTFLGLARIPRLSRELLVVPLIAFIVIGVSGLIASQVARWLRLRRPTAGALVITSMCGSTGFFGAPLFQELSKQTGYTETLGIHAFYSEIGTLLPLLTVVVLVASYYGEGQRWSWSNALKGLFRFLPFIALLLGLLFWPETHGERFPAVITATLGFLQSATVMLSMVALGMTITVRDFSQYLRSVVSVNIIKLVIGPLVALGLALLFGLGEQARFVVVIDSAIPAILIAIAYSGQYKLDVEFASTAVFATFLLSPITLLIWAALVRI